MSPKKYVNYGCQDVRTKQTQFLKGKLKKVNTNEGKRKKLDFPFFKKDQLEKIHRFTIGQMKQKAKHVKHL